jgi:hypothetical protein
MDSVKDQPHGQFGYLELTGFPAVLELERRFLPPEAQAKYELSLGEYDPRVI